jgi:hypothetical protein
MVKNKVEIDSERLSAFIYKYDGSLGSQKAYDDCIASMKSKVQLFAEGYYKKHGGEK